MEEADARVTPPYLPFRTLLNVFDQLGEQGVPHRIDRSVFPTQSGAVQGQIIATLRFFGLIDASGVPAGRALESMAKDKSLRKVSLRTILGACYKQLISRDLTKMSPLQLDQEFEGYGVTGTTKTKAKTFFIKAAQYTDLPLSPLLTKKTRNSTGARKRKGASASRASDQDQAHLPRPPGATNTESFTVNLKTGGVITVQLDVNLLDLEGDDRAYVFKLIDDLKSYGGRFNGEK